VRLCRYRSLQTIRLKNCTAAHIYTAKRGAMHMQLNVAEDALYTLARRVVAGTKKPPGEIFWLQNSCNRKFKE
jgi:hypothetical protein